MSREIWIKYMEILIIVFFFNKRDLISACPFQLRRSYKRHEENKSKIEQERNSKQQADYQCHRPTPWMQESVSMHKSHTPFKHSRMNQARSEEEEKERKRGRKDRGQEADGKKGSPNKTKHIGGTKTRPTYLSTG